MPTRIEIRIFLKKKRASPASYKPLSKPCTMRDMSTVIFKSQISWPQAMVVGGHRFRLGSIMEIEFSLKDFWVTESPKEPKVSYRFGSTWKMQVNLSSPFKWHGRFEDHESAQSDSSCFRHFNHFIILLVVWGQIKCIANMLSHLQANTGTNNELKSYSKQRQ